MIILGDLTKWCSEILERELTKVIDRNQYRENLYWIMVINKPRYLGPKQGVKETKDVLLKGVNRIINTTLVVIPDKSMLPSHRQLGTALLRVDNRKGEAKWIYVLPVDAPLTQPVDFDGQSELVGKSAQGIPLKFSRN